VVVDDLDVERASAKAGSGLINEGKRSAGRNGLVVNTLPIVAMMRPMYTTSFAR
jgi:hypothetical protein